VLTFCHDWFAQRSTKTVAEPEEPAGWDQKQESHHVQSERYVRVAHKLRSVVDGGWDANVRSQRYKGQSVKSVLLLSVGNENTEYLWGGGASQEGCKLLSINVTLCYLDSNYTCPLSLSPHPSLSSVSLNPRTLDFSVSVEAMRSFLSSFIHLQPPCVSVSITASSILGLTSAL